MTDKKALKLALDDLMVEYDMERTSFAKLVDEIFKQAPPAQPAPVNQRAHEMALRQWESWKQYALELQEKLVKYEGGAPMVLNTTSPAAQPAQPAPVQEPVAWMYQCTADNSRPVLLQHRTNWAESGTGLWIETPLYTTSPAQPAPVQEPEPEQEPVGTVQCMNGVTIGYLEIMQPVGTKLYTTAPAAQRKPLTALRSKT